MSKETKFGYGFLLAGIGLPYLIEKFLGPLWAVVASIVCVVGGVALLVSGHLHRDAPQRRRGLMTTIWMFTLVGGAIGMSAGAISGLVWSVVQKRSGAPEKPIEATPRPAAKTTLKAADEKPPTLADLFRSDFSNVAKLTDDVIGIQWKDGKVLHIKRQLYLDFPANTKFVGFYIPESDPLSSTKSVEACLELAKASAVQQALDDMPKKVFVGSGSPEGMTSIQDLTFSGRVLIYHEAFLSITQKANIIHAYTARHWDVQFRGPDYLGNQVIAWHHSHDAKAGP